MSFFVSDLSGRPTVLHTAAHEWNGTCVIPDSLLADTPDEAVEKAIASRCALLEEKYKTAIPFIAERKENFENVILELAQMIRSKNALISLKAGVIFSRAQRSK